MNRAVLTLPSFFWLPLATLACNGKVSRAECTEMLDKYIDMSVAGEPASADLSSSTAAELRAEREAKKGQRKRDPRYVRVQEQCEAETSRREYRCAMKAPTPEAWQACID